jgi:hypothetical protein
MIPHLLETHVGCGAKGTAMKAGQGEMSPLPPHHLPSPTLGMVFFLHTSLLRLFQHVHFLLSFFLLFLLLLSSVAPSHFLLKNIPSRLRFVGVYCALLVCWSHATSMVSSSRFAFKFDADATRTLILAQQCALSSSLLSHFLFVTSPLKFSSSCLR